MNILLAVLLGVIGANLLMDLIDRFGPDTTKESEEYLELIEQSEKMEDIM